MSNILTFVPFEYYLKIITFWKSFPFSTKSRDILLKTFDTKCITDVVYRERTSMVVRVLFAGPADVINKG